MPHRPKPRGYDALDIYLSTQESAEVVLAARDWSDKQQTHIENFKDYSSVNKIEFTRNNKTQHRFKDKKTGRFVRGY